MKTQEEPPLLDVTQISWVITQLLKSIEWCNVEQGIVVCIIVTQATALRKHCQKGDLIDILSIMNLLGPSEYAWKKLSKMGYYLCYENHDSSMEELLFALAAEPDQEIAMWYLGRGHDHFEFAEVLMFVLLAKRFDLPGNDDKIRQILLRTGEEGNIAIEKSPDSKLRFRLELPLY